MRNITSLHDLTWFECALIIAARRRAQALSTALGDNPNPAGYVACQSFLEAYDPVYADTRAERARLAAAAGPSGAG